MGSPKKILYSGDTHGDASQILWLVRKAVQEDAEAVFVLGDFGIWDHSDQGRFTKTCSREAQRTEVPVYFLPGNHDNYDLLEQYERENSRDEDGFVEVRPGVLYSPRGHRWTWHGVRFLSLGGAYSIDKDWRIRDDAAMLHGAQQRDEAGFSLNAKQRYILKHGQYLWWRQEEITEAERDRAMEGGEVDVMLTHDKPFESSPRWNRKNIPECEPNQQKISAVVMKTKPSLLLHGHLHYAYGDVLPSTGTVVRALDCDPDASRASGGSGERALSYAAMTFLSGDDAPGYVLRWTENDEARTLTHRFRGGQ